MKKFLSLFIPFFIVLPNYGMDSGQSSFPSCPPLTRGKCLLISSDSLPQPLRPYMQKPDEAADPVFSYTTFLDWYNRCLALPYYNGSADQQEVEPTLMWSEFERALYAFAAIAKRKMNNSEQWIDGDDVGQKGIPGQYFFTLGETENISCNSFAPFAQTLIVPEDATIAFRGDLHGDIHALITQLNSLRIEGYLSDKDPFKIAKSNFYMIFLGDYVDRGHYGVEVLYTLMRLKIANPDRVFMVRGNHEDQCMNLDGFGGTFSKELYEHFGWAVKDWQKARSVFRLYDFLPVVLYLGSGSPEKTSYIQCCHGGMEVGYDPKKLLSERRNAFQWLGKITQQKNIEKLSLPDNQRTKLAKYNCFINYTPESPCTPVPNGFMWNDFYVDSQKFFSCDGTRGLKFGKALTQAVLEAGSSKTCSIKGVFRAHQHYGAMIEKLLEHNGLYKLWQSDEAQKQLNLYDGIVCTFMLAPDGPAGQDFGFNYDTFALLKTAQKFSDWTLRPITHEIFPHNKSLVPAKSE